jgi:ThiJ/PfpI family-like
MMTVTQSSIRERAITCAFFLIRIRAPGRCSSSRRKLRYLNPMSTPAPRPVLIVLPKRDFDPSEVAIPWKVLLDAGNSLIFATPDGLPAAADPLMLSGEELDFWGRIPVLRKIKVLGLALRANGDARRAYSSMQASVSFGAPVPYASLGVDQYDGLVLPGGHWARGMRQYLEDEIFRTDLGSRLLPDLSRGGLRTGRLSRRAG